MYVLLLSSLHQYITCCAYSYIYLHFVIVINHNFVHNDNLTRLAMKTSGSPSVTKLYVHCPDMEAQVEDHGYSQ